jgi:hypothetical protein
MVHLQDDERFRPTDGLGFGDGLGIVDWGGACRATTDFLLVSVGGGACCATTGFPLVSVGGGAFRATTDFPLVSVGGSATFLFTSFALSFFWLGTCSLTRAVAS